MKKKLSELCLFWISASLAQTAPHVISFFIRPLPATFKPSEKKQKIAHEVKTPGKILKSVVKKTLRPILFYSGIYAAYAGNFTHSTTDGQVLFERSTPEAVLHVLITEDMKVIPVNPINDKTVYGFAIDPKAESAQYIFERVQDPETELDYWKVSPEPIRKKKSIAPDTIIIFAQPKTIIVPVGKTATNLSENLILPDFYATKQNKSAANAFRF